VGERGEGFAHRFVARLSFSFSSSSSLLSLFLYLQLGRVERGGEVVEPASGERLLDQGLGVGHDVFFLLPRTLRSSSDVRAREQKRSEHGDRCCFSTCIRFDGEKRKSIGEVLSALSTNGSCLVLLPPQSTSISAPCSLSHKKRETMTVEEPRRADSSWRMRPSSLSAAAAASAGEQSANPLVVSFPAGFHPPVSGWEAYEGGPGGQQLLVVARAVR